MALPWCRVLIVIIVAVSDIAVYFYGIYVSNSSQVPIGYAAHISGAIAGLLVGIVCLKNLRWEPDWFNHCLQCGFSQSFHWH
jgi:membrane associated rhomboid family serine protease